MAVTSQREVQIGAKTLVIYMFDYSGAIEDFEVPATIQQVASLHMDAGLGGLSSGESVPSVVLTDVASASTTTFTRTVRVGTTSGPVGRLIITALAPGASGSFGMSQDSSVSTNNPIMSPK